MDELSPNERHALKDLVEQLITATDGGTYWPSRIQETAIELRDRITRWLDSEDSNSPRGNDE